MSSSGLPLASSEFEDTKVGNISIRTEKPSESPSVIRKSIQSLEEAVENKVFTENDQSSESL